MSKLLEGALGSFTGVAAGTAKNIAALTGVRALVSGTFVGTVTIEVSFDEGTTWAIFQTLTAVGLSNELPPCGRVRANCTAFTSGTIVADYGGRNPDVRG